MPTSITAHNHSTSLYCESFGQGVPVLLIAGAMAPRCFWVESFCNGLASRGFQVIRFDNRDMGLSTHFAQSAPGSGVCVPYSMDDMVADCLAVLDAHSSGAAHVVGHSMGGSIAQMFAVAHPGRVLSVTAIASPIIARGDIPFVETDPAILDALWKVLMANPMHQDFELGAPEFLAIWRHLHGDWDLDQDMANAYTRAIYETETIGPAWNHTNVQQDLPDIFPQLATLDIPLLFLHGSKDYLPTNPANPAILAQHLNGHRARLRNQRQHQAPSPHSVQPSGQHQDRHSNLHQGKYHGLQPDEHRDQHSAKPSGHHLNEYQDLHKEQCPDRPPEWPSAPNPGLSLPPVQSRLIPGAGHMFFNNELWSMILDWILECIGQTMLQDDQSKPPHGGI